MTVITISRQLGSGGDEIAATVCEQLGYRYFDKEMMVEAASHAGLCEAEVVDLNEDQYKVQDFISRLLGARPRMVKEVLVREAQHGIVETLTARELNEEDCLTLIRYTIERAHTAGRVVIVGRGGQAILQDEPDVLHVRIVAPIGSRIARLQQREGLSIEEAERQITRHDRASAEYLGRFFGIQWDDHDLYHLMVNTGKISADGAAQIIVDAIVQLRASMAG